MIIRLEAKKALITRVGMIIPLMIINLIYFAGVIGHEVGEFL